MTRCRKKGSLISSIWHQTGDPVLLLLKHSLKNKVRLRLPWCRYQLCIRICQLIANSGPENSFLLTRLPRQGPALGWLQCLSQVVHLSSKVARVPHLDADAKPRFLHRKYQFVTEPFYCSEERQIILTRFPDTIIHKVWMHSIFCTTCELQ